MSYSGSIQVIDCDVQMAALNVRKAIRRLAKEDATPESSFLQGVENDAIDAEDDTTLIRIPRDKFWWQGNHVGREPFEWLAPMIVGRLSGYFSGEDGSNYDGFEIDGGKFYKCDVTVALKRET